ncbi:alanine racemase [Mycolicibacterium komossense]|uniref:Alanine racemase n=1 Tax=Mycolicibacterium komossense TaxID=1779 RepID=A0ABT3C952_9MYCO|nr:alanine racemase [Mycolicibacterium komossense]MCV7225781.1 alanine racemase [Mycolicibacterium komossense]
MDLAAVRHNTAVLTPHRSALLVMVKGNAYGHGAFEIARTVLDAGAQWLGVSFVEEGIGLRSASLTAPILVTTEAPRGDEERALRAGLDLTVYSFAAIDRVADAGRRTGTTPRVHIKLNTGLNRVGAPPEQAAALADRAVAAGLDVRGVWTHFAVAEQLGNPATETQLNRMLVAAETIRSSGRCDPWLHAANTAAILAYPEAHLDMVRAGIGIYGYLPDHDLPRAHEIEPALAWRTSVSHVKRLAAGQGVSYGFTARTTAPTTVATVPVGFADGYPRRLSNRADVLVHGRRFPIMGTIAMDQMLIDCGDQPVDVGDDVTLIGAQGAQVVTVDELAALAGTIADEILCGIHPRVPRHYVN